MGTIYYVSCRTCKLTKDLGKFYECHAVPDEAALEELHRSMQEPVPAYRAARLLQFMWLHSGHDVTLYDEHNEEVDQECAPWDIEENPPGGEWSIPDSGWREAPEFGPPE